MSENEELSLAERAYRAIRDSLVMLDIRPGEPINEDRLAQDLGVGRTPVREALKRLQYERLIATYPRRGTFATEVNITDLAHISEVRLRLEPMAAAQAARRATDQDRGALTELLQELEKVRSGRYQADELMRLDLQVHRAIYAATHNPYLEDTLVRHDNLATRIWCLFLDRLPGGVIGHVEEHRPLLRAVIDGRPDQADELASRHVEGFEKAVRAAI
ncbi:GntR family transcriptional regulator [Streptomyces smyrnaeus]|uniref:GntR family transcriptional regulator n=1 Tax=Streptomyces smyrnaeus TaxID=1387713 RepID=UPI0033A5FC49